MPQQEGEGAKGADESKRFKTFKDFYPFYLGEHSNSTCRRLHVLGTSLSVVLAGAAILSRKPKLLLAVPAAGYGCAWLGHFAFEKNRPATFQFPVWSLRGDFKMWFEVLTGRRAF